MWSRLIRSLIPCSWWGGVQEAAWQIWTMAELQRDAGAHEKNVDSGHPEQILALGVTLVV